MSRRALHLLVLLVLLCGSPGSGHADGKMFPPRAVPVELRMPDQRALLWWSNGVERLVIETRFVGEGTNFAWVVPLPSAPKVEAATTGLFPTLVHLLQPEVVHRPPPVIGLVLAAVGLAWLLLQIKPDKPVCWTDWAASIAIGGGLSLLMQEEGISGLLGLPCFAAAISASAFVRKHGGSPALVPLALVGVFMLAGMFLPAFAKAGGSGSGSSVEILDRQFAGVFETATITGRDPAALRGWLETNGYALPKEVEPVIADYLRDGWVFAASKVRRDAAASGTNSLHPLSFTFATKEPVYPLRLTGVGNGPLDVELFVFGPERAKADGFKVLDCRHTDYSQRDSPEWFLPRNRLVMTHPGLATAAPESLLVTRLSGQLSPDQMRQDAVIRWDGFAEARDVRYSARGALVTALNWTGSTFCLFVLGVAVVSRVQGREPGTYRRPTLLVAGVVLLTTAVIYGSLPVIPVTLENRFARYSDARNQFLAVRIALADELPTNAPVTLESVRAAIRRGLPVALSEAERKRLGYEIREEDSPYNYSLHSVPDGVEVWFHGTWGSPEVERYPR